MMGHIIQILVEIMHGPPACVFGSQTPERKGRAAFPGRNLQLVVRCWEGLSAIQRLASKPRWTPPNIAMRLTALMLACWQNNTPDHYFVCWPPGVVSLGDFLRMTVTLGIHAYHHVV